MDAEEIKAKIRVAEAAVAGMPDDALRKAAFETVLSKLLGGLQSEEGVRTSKAAKPTNSKKRASATKSGKSSQRQEPESTLELNVENLQALKVFYDEHAPDGTEESVFTLAQFIHEKLGLKKFHEGDLLRVYQNLLSLKPTTKPPAMAYPELKRAVSWLMAPSRKKQWLRNTSDGQLEITSQGMLHMSYGKKAQAKKQHAS